MFLRGAFADRNLSFINATLIPRREGTSMGRASNRLRRLASLSALASAALAASGGSGEAAIIYHPTKGFTAPGSLPLPGGNSLSLTKSRSGFVFTDSVSTIHRRGGFIFQSSTTHAAARGAAFRAVGSDLAVTKKGRTFNMVGTRIRKYPVIGYRRYFSDQTVGVAFFRSGSGKGVTRPLQGSVFASWVQRTNGRSQFTLNGQNYTNIYFSAYRRFTSSNFPNYNDEYALFRFDDGGQIDYGWLELSVAGGANPIVNVLGYAYDTSGKPIKAGEVPEPQHLPVALGALALGAVGLREWRKKRNAAT